MNAEQIATAINAVSENEKSFAWEVGLIKLRGWVPSAVTGEILDVRMLLLGVSY